MGLNRLSKGARACRAGNHSLGKERKIAKRLTGATPLFVRDCRRPGCKHQQKRAGEYKHDITGKVIFR